MTPMTNKDIWWTAQALVFGEGDHVTATTQAPEGLRFLLAAGRPINEPIVQYGPFVMNTEVRVISLFFRILVVNKHFFLFYREYVTTMKGHRNCFS